MNLESVISGLLEKEREYFVVSISHCTDNHLWDIKNNLVGATSEEDQIATEVFEKVGVYLYVDDLYTSVHATKKAKEVVPKLIEEYGKKRVTEELAKQMRTKGFLIKDSKEVYKRWIALPYYPE